MDCVTLLWILDFSSNIQGFQFGLLYFSVDPGTVVMIVVCQCGSWNSSVVYCISVKILTFQCGILPHYPECYFLECTNTLYDIDIVIRSNAIRDNGSFGDMEFGVMG